MNGEIDRSVQLLSKNKIDKRKSPFPKSNKLKKQSELPRKVKKNISPTPNKKHKHKSRPNKSKFVITECVVNNLENIADDDFIMESESDTDFIDNDDITLKNK